MEIYSAFNIKVNNTNREAGRFPYFFCALGKPFEKLIHFSAEMSFHHRVTQSITEFYSFDFKLIKLCETPLDLHY